MSNSYRTRHFVIDYSVLLEELVSITLGRLLNLEWKTSKSFGFGSSSLSFNQKIQIVQDLKGVNSLRLKKLQYFMYVRNKFAHIREIESFDHLFNMNSKGKDVKKFFDKEYITPVTLEKIDENNSIVEMIYSVCYSRLCSDIITLFEEIMETHSFEKGFQQGEADTQKRFIDLLLDEVQSMSEGKDMILKVLNQLKIEN